MTAAFILMAALAFMQVEPKTDGAKPAVAAASPLAAKVAQLIRRLDDAELAEREKAEQELAALGPAALDLLPNAPTTGERKERLDRVRKLLETKAVAAATKECRVTLAGKMTVAEAFASLERQSQNKLRADGVPPSQIEIDCQNLPYWEALDRVLDAAELTLNPFGGEGLSVVERPKAFAKRAGQATYSGVFRLEPLRVLAVRDLRRDEIRGLKIALELAWEPRVSPIALELPLSSIQAAGDTGQAIGVDASEGNLHVAVHGQRCVTEIELPLALPERDVAHIASLKGTLHALIPGRVEEFAFDNLAAAKNVLLDRAGVTVELREVRKNQELFEVRVIVRYQEAANAFESHRTWIDRNEAYLLDAAGQRVEAAAFETGARKANEQVLSYLFAVDKGLSGCKFVYRTPAALVKTPVTFELRNLPLP